MNSVTYKGAFWWLDPKKACCCFKTKEKLQFKRVKRQKNA